MTDDRRPIALITGGSRGLGRSMAQHLVQRGTDVIITYRERSDDAAGLVEQARAAGGRAAALRLDVGDAASFGAFADALRGELGRSFQTERFDFLVNNAGHGVHASVTETTEAQLDALVTRALTNLEALAKAPIADPYTGPAILEPEATGV
ncbi:MAG: SDR family oxidoreductase, partial [Myxococcales bacterium]|nr:SDR family oxidoreductase [Myxococcales bacterium]